MRKLFDHISHLTTEQLSTRVLYVLVAITVVVFALFFTVGYDKPYADDPQFNAPQFTDAVLMYIYLLIVAACAVALYSLIRALRRHDDSEDVVNNLPAAKIKLYTFGILAAVLIITFLTGSTEPVIVNGMKFTDAMWLRLTDTFINTSITLLVVAALGVAFGLSGRSRKLVLKKPRKAGEKQKQLSDNDLKA